MNSGELSRLEKKGDAVTNIRGAMIPH
jgi:hypothetical protein